MTIVITNSKQADGRYKATWIDHELGREYVGKGQTKAEAQKELVEIIQIERTLMQLA